MMAYNADLGIASVRFVMDKRIASAANMEHMREMRYPFIIAVETRLKVLRGTLDNQKHEVCSARHRIDSLKVFGMGIKSRFYGVTSTLHIYYRLSALRKNILKPLLNRDGIRITTRWRSDTLNFS
jgi:hypothetical protein